MDSKSEPGIDAKHGRSVIRISSSGLADRFLRKKRYLIVHDDVRRVAAQRRGIRRLRFENATVTELQRILRFADIIDAIDGTFRQKPR